MTFRLGPCRDPVLLTNDDQPNRAWACGDCGAIYGGGLGEKTAREHCAQRICECGQVLREHYTSCDACMERSAKAAERERYEKAEKIPWQKYDGLHVQSPVTGEYYPDVDTMLDSEDDPPEEPPAWAWACNAVHLKFDARGLILRQLEADEHHEDSMASVSDKEVAALQELLDSWSVNIAVETYFPDYTRAVTCEYLVQQRLEDLGLDEDEVEEGK